MSVDDPWTREGELKEMHTHEIENMKLMYLLCGVLVGLGISTLVVGCLWVVY